MTEEYVPDKGDLVWLEFMPQAGREQSGRRPALTLSPRSYNGVRGMALFCPITSNIKGYPFEVALPSDAEITGAVLCDQVRSLDWRARWATFAGRSSPRVIEDVTEKIGLLLGIPGL